MDKNNYCYGLLTVKMLIFMCMISLSLSFTSCADNHVEHKPKNTQESSSTAEQQEPDISSKETTATYEINQYFASSGFIATMCDDKTYYYSDVIYDPQELAYYISLAEYAGSVEVFLDDEAAFPKSNLESNHLPVETKLYLLDSYLIAEFSEPHQWQSRIIYGQVLMLDSTVMTSEELKQLLYDYLRNGYYKDIMSDEEFKKGFEAGEFIYIGDVQEYSFCYYMGLIIAPSAIEYQLGNYIIYNSSQTMPSIIGIYAIDTGGNVTILEDMKMTKQYTDELYSILPKEMKR